MDFIEDLYPDEGVLVTVSRITVPAFSTIGYGWGVEVETGKEIEFVGDHRPMRRLGEQLVGEPVVVMLDEWQIVGAK